MPNVLYVLILCFLIQDLSDKVSERGRFVHLSLLVLGQLSLRTVIRLWLDESNLTLLPLLRNSLGLHFVGRHSNGWLFIEQRFFI